MFKFYFYFYFLRIAINHLFNNNIFWFGWSISQRMRVYNYGCCDIYNTVEYVLFTDKSEQFKLYHNYPIITYSSLNLISFAFRSCIYLMLIICSIYFHLQYKLQLKIHKGENGRGLFD